MTGKQTAAELAAKLRDVASKAKSFGYQSWSVELREIAAALETTDATIAALEAKLAEWAKVGAETVIWLQFASGTFTRADTSISSSDLAKRISALLAEPDPLVDIVKQAFHDAGEKRVGDARCKAVVAELRKRGIELGTKP